MYLLVKPWAVFTDHDPDAPSTHSLVLKPSWSNGPREHVPLPKVDGRAAGQIWRTSFLSSHLLWTGAGETRNWSNEEQEQRATAGALAWNTASILLFSSPLLWSWLIGTSHSPCNQNIVSRLSSFGFTRSHLIYSKDLPSISARNLQEPHFLFNSCSSTFW